MLFGDKGTNLRYNGGMSTCLMIGSTMNAFLQFECSVQPLLCSAGMPTRPSAGLYLSTPAGTALCSTCCAEHCAVISSSFHDLYWLSTSFKSAAETCQNAWNFDHSWPVQKANLLWVDMGISSPCWLACSYPWRYSVCAMQTFYYALRKCLMSLLVSDCVIAVMQHFSAGCWWLCDQEIVVSARTELSAPYKQAGMHSTWESANVWDCSRLGDLHFTKCVIGARNRPLSGKLLSVVSLLLCNTLRFCSSWAFC